MIRFTTLPHYWLVAAGFNCISIIFHPRKPKLDGPQESGFPADLLKEISWGQVRDI